MEPNEKREMWENLARLAAVGATLASGFIALIIAGVIEEFVTSNLIVIILVWTGVFILGFSLSMKLKAMLYRKADQF